MTEWKTIGKGIQARNHKKQKYCKRPDRYLRGRYVVGGKLKIVGFGYESEWAAAEKSRIEKDGIAIAKRTLLEYATAELERLRANAKAEIGPVTLREDWELQKEKSRAEAAKKAEDEKLSITFAEYFEKHYYQGAQISKGKKSFKTEESHFHVWLNPYLGKIRLMDIRPIHIEKLKREMLKDGKTPRTIQAVLATARQVWNHAMTERYSHVRNDRLQDAVKNMERAGAKQKARSGKVIELRKKSENV